MDSKKSFEIEHITISVKEGSILAKRLHELKQAIEKINPDKTYGWDKLTIDQMASSRDEAIAKGHSHFFDGLPCRNGHIAPRSKRGECNHCTNNVSMRHLRKKGVQPRFPKKKKTV